jgi:hypothetical protein
MMHLSKSSIGVGFEARIVGRHMVSVSRETKTIDDTIDENENERRNLFIINETNNDLLAILTFPISNIGKVEELSNAWRFSIKIS